MPFAIALCFALIHVLGYRMTFLKVTPRSIWLSAAGGVAVAYVFVHLLPELAAHQATISERLGKSGLVGGVEQHSYLLALLGLATFYGLDRAARQSARDEERKGRSQRPPESVFWIHLTAFAVYNVLIGYLLLHREEAEQRGLLIYAFAMGLHFIVNDHGLREQHGRAYDEKGRWLLAAAPVAGWALGFANTISTTLISALFAFLAGGVVLNVLKEELPEERESRFWAFALGAAAYSGLLLATE